MAKTHLAVLLLLTNDLAVFRYLHKHDLLLVAGQKHEHAGSEIAGS